MSINKEKQEYLKVEHCLRFMIGDIKPNDYYYLDNIKHNMLVFLLKDKVDENNDVFLENMKYEFEYGINKLSTRYPNLKKNFNDIYDFAMKYIFTKNIKGED